jgi:hypothetical protein
MIQILKIACVVTLMAVNAFICGFLGLFFCLSCSRVTTGFQASQMVPMDWIFMAGRRATEAILVAVAVGAFLAVMNRLIVGSLFPERKRLDWLLAGSPAIIIVLGALLGSMLFVVDKPFM